MLLILLISACALSHIGCVPTVNVEPDKKLVFEKDPEVVFTCTVQPYSEDDAELKIRWLFQDKLIYFDDKTVLDDGTLIKKYIEIHKDKASKELRIRNINRRDEGSYKCQVIFEKTEVETIGELTVGYLDKNPFIKCDMPLFNSTSGNNITTIEGQSLQVNMSCKAFIGNNVFVNITIINSASRSTALAHSVYSHFEEQSSPVRGVSVSHAVNITGLDGQQFWCVADHPKMSHPVNCSTLSLMTPKVKIVNVSDDNTQFESKVESYPQFTSYQWKLCRNSGKEQEIQTYVQDEECKVLNSTSSNLTLPNNAELKDGFIVKCEVENAVGTGHGNLTITQDIKTEDEMTAGDSNSNLVKWSISVFTVLFIVIFVLLYFGKRSRWGTHYKRKKKAEIFEEVKVSTACTPDISHFPQNTADQFSLYATPAKKRQCTSNENHSQSVNQKIPPEYYTLENVNDAKSTDKLTK